MLTKLAHGLPEGALALARGPNLSLRAIQTLSDANIRDLKTLRDAAKNGTLRTLPGFSEKTEARILSSMDQREQSHGQIILRDAIEMATDVKTFLREDARPLKRTKRDKNESIRDLKIDVVGDVRRGTEVIGAIDLLATTNDPDAILARFETYPRILAIESRTPGRMSDARLQDGLHVRLHAVLPDARAAAMQRLTGSEAHNAAFDRAAKAAHLVVEEDGVYELSNHAHTRARIEIASEEDLYARAKLDFVSPLLRSTGEEIALARDHMLPKLIQVKDVRGMVHCHSDFSDGRHALEQMARAAQDLGMQYITITDHSPTASYAHGVEIDRLRTQWDEIARAQESLTIRILRGTESDILKDGALDYPDAILEQLDVSSPAFTIAIDSIAHK
jgi:DNA polymerase (family 10)